MISSVCMVDIIAYSSMPYVGIVPQKMIATF